jgi:hypothetical protein
MALHCTVQGVTGPEPPMVQGLPPSKGERSTGGLRKNSSQSPGRDVVTKGAGHILEKDGVWLRIRKVLVNTWSTME